MKNDPRIELTSKLIEDDPDYKPIMTALHDAIQNGDSVTAKAKHLELEQLIEKNGKLAVNILNARL